MKKKFLQYSIGPLGVAFISLITLPLIAWFYSVEDVAKFSIFQSILILYALVFSWGLDQAFIREYFESKNKNQLLSDVLIGIFAPVVIITLLITFIFGKYITLFLYDEYTFLLYFLTISSCFLSLTIRILSSIQRVQDQAVLYSLSQISPKLIFLIFLLMLTFLSQRNFENILIAQFSALIFVNFFFIFINRDYLIKVFKVKFDLNNIKKYYLFGFPLIFTGILMWGLKLADRFYLKLFSDLGALGIYAMAISIASGVSIFAGVFNTIWSPLVYKWVNNGEIKSIEVVNKVNKISIQAVFFILGLSIISIFASKIIVLFLPDAYHDIYLIIPLCVLSALLYTLSEITGIGINLTKKTKYTLWSCIGAILVHLGCSVALIPTYGAIGAAVSGLFAFYVFFLMRSVFSNLVWMRLKLYFVNFIVLLSVFISCVPIFLVGKI